MEIVAGVIEVAKPLSTVYDQWTRFEMFPEFMEGIEEVHPLDDRRLRWAGKTAGAQRSWEAEIVERVPDRRIAWRSIEADVANTCTVSFQAVGPAATRVHLFMGYQPESLGEKTGDARGLFRRRVESDLERFKEFIERRGDESGARRGEI